MATRSTISLVNKDASTITSVYSHWDGYPQHNGAILFSQYDTVEKIEKLLSFGAISSLGSEIETELPHSFETPQKGVTVFYTRDRGDKLLIDVTPFEKGFSIVSWVKSMRKIGQEFNYIFVDGKWFVEYEGKVKELTPAIIEKGF